MAEGTYPADPARAALRLFGRWLGTHYARSTAFVAPESNGGVLVAPVTVGRRWEISVTVLNTLEAEASVEFESTRSAVESRLDRAGRSLAVWVPRGAPLPSGEPAVDQFVRAVDAATALADDRFEIRRKVRLFLRRTSTTGSVITVLGGLSAHWAKFTNRVPGSFQLNSSALCRLPESQQERDALAERIVLAAGQPTIDETGVIEAEDAWTASDLGEGGSCVIGSPRPDTDEQSAALRRNLRSLLHAQKESPQAEAAARALVVLGAATYAADEKLSWALRGMDPALYAGYDIIAVVTDGVVKPLLEPPRQTLPWDAPPG